MTQKVKCSLAFSSRSQFLRITNLNIMFASRQVVAIVVSLFLAAPAAAVSLDQVCANSEWCQSLRAPTAKRSLN
jgi:hypothetical protein